MSDLIVLTFDNMDEAGRMRETLREVEHRGNVKLSDTAVIVKDAEGKVHVRNQVSSGTKWGAVGGAVLGPLLFFLFPIAGIAVGAGLGALVGKLFGTRYLATLYGLTMLSHQIGGFFGAWLGGLAFSYYGNYLWMWYADALFAALAALLNLPIREPRLEPRAVPA